MFATECLGKNHQNLKPLLNKIYKPHSCFDFSFCMDFRKPRKKNCSSISLKFLDPIKIPKKTSNKTRAFNEKLSMSI
ncbi:MAG: hypothetical protein CME68_06970 [Halobacteriovoraceae bacterium]|nr:hypothetical protein [Halobacteriovoraceae bacterium]